MEEVNKLSRPMWHDYGFLTGRIGKIGGRDVVITHRDPQTGKLWCEGINNNPEADCWVDSDKVEIL